MACGMGAEADAGGAKGERHAARAGASAGHLPTVPRPAFVLPPVLLPVLLTVSRLKPWEHYEDSYLSPAQHGRGIPTLAVRPPSQRKTEVAHGGTPP